MTEIGNQTELYLVAHKVRGEPAFDVATRMECPHCDGSTWGTTTEDPNINEAGCHECDSLGYWWIIPTSGHRAYPWWHTELFHEDFKCVILLEADANGMCEVPSMPPDLPDHYTTRAAPTQSLADMLGMLHAPLTRKAPPIKRRF